MSEIIEWKIGSSLYRGNPKHGARLFSWHLVAAHKKRSIIHWPEKETSDVPYSKIRGGNPILFPFASVCYDKGIAETWRYAGERLPMPRHGFARDGQFEIIEMKENGFKSVLIPTQEDLVAYPFKYDFTVSYLFEELSFKVNFELHNKDEKAIPWSAGHHFYFTLPWHEKAIRNDYSIQLEYRKCAYFSSEGKLIPEKDKESEFSFDDPRIVDRIHYSLKNNRVSFGPKGGEEQIHILVDEERVPCSGKTVVTWTESEKSPFYCVEPWMGPPNSQEHGKGLHWVKPGETEKFTVEVSLY